MEDIKPYFRKCLLDSPELKRRYKGHAYQLRQVKRRTAKVFDERRQCFLYEDGEIVGEKLIGNGSQRLKPYKWYRRGPKYHRKLFDWLKAKLDKALAAAFAAIAEDEDEVVPPVVRHIPIQKNDDLERMRHEIDSIATGDHSSVVRNGSLIHARLIHARHARRKTLALVRTCKNALLSFRRVRKSILQATAFEWGVGVCIR